MTIQIARVWIEGIWVSEGLVQHTGCNARDGQICKLNAVLGNSTQTSKLNFQSSAKQFVPPSPSLYPGPSSFLHPNTVNVADGARKRN